MANGKCSKCDVQLTEENSPASTLKRGSGYCRRCSSIYQAPHNSRRASGVPARHGSLIATMREENVPSDDRLWDREAYKNLISCNLCHYCEGPLNQTGHCLDAKDNPLGHVWGNVVPCCTFCNEVKSNRLVGSPGTELEFAL